jgi:hypothetical protein
MKRAVAVVATLFRCGIVGGLYGAILGLTYIQVRGVADGLQYVPSMLPLLVCSVVVYGFLTGFVSGMVGGCLGGPIGFGIGGIVGTAALVLTFTGGVDALRSAMPDGLYMIAWGAAFGLVLGQHIRRRVPLFPGVDWLADSIYSSPLGGWLGWRHRQSPSQIKPE